MNALELLTLTDEQKVPWWSEDWSQRGGGVWLGEKKNSEYKEWFYNGKMGEHSQYKNNQLHGICKAWDFFGHLDSHKLFNNGQLIKDFLNSP